MHTSKPVTITATELQQKSGQILKRVFAEQAHIIVERDGYPVAAIIPVTEYRARFVDETGKDE
jgi:prevent-host-death family protein